MRTDYESEHPRLAAVLWDLDGTLVDTEDAWTRARDAIAREHGASWSQQLSDALVGTSLPESARGLADAGVPLGEEAIQRQLIDQVLMELEDLIPWRPGACDLLAELVDAGIRCAMVTMAYRDVATRVADAVPGSFEIIIAGDDVTRSKPDPECYRRATAALSVDPAACVALEDTERGVLSATAAGLRVVAVASSRPIAPGAGRVVVPCLTDLNVPALTAVLATPPPVEGARGLASQGPGQSA